MTIRERSTTTQRLSLLAAAVLIGAGSPAAFALGPGEVFVADYYQNTVTVYSRTASGTTTPKRTIRTGLTNPFDVLVDQLHGEVFVTNNTNGSSRIGSVEVYDINANYPNDKPKRTIAGVQTGLFGSTGLALDILRNELYVANDDIGTITVFSRTASGNATPSRTIQGSATNLAGPLAVYLDLLHDELIVVNKVVLPGGDGRITVYPRASNGNVGPSRMISGSNTGFDLPVGMDLDVLRDEIVVANANTNAILVFHRKDNGNVAPTRVVQGPHTGLCSPYAPVVDLLNNELIVTNSGYGQAACEPSTVVFSTSVSGDVTPRRTLNIGLSPSSYPVGMAETPLNFN